MGCGGALQRKSERTGRNADGSDAGSVFADVDEAFGIWTSHSLVINANTNNHKDLEDVCHGWCAIVVFGDFEGGDACFPELGVKIDCTPGM